MKKGLLILLPGIRYSVDCPLLYYTRIAYSYAGYEVIPVDDYGVRDTEDLDEYADKASKNLVKRLKDVDLSEYEHVIFAEKSVGTVIGMMLEDMLGADNITHILYTPLEAIYAYLNKERSIAGVASGTDDKHIEIKALRAACKKLGLPLVEIKNTGHRLEGGSDVIKDIGAIGQVIASIGTPQTAEKLWKEEKAEADKKAAEEKAAKEKAAKEKAAKEKAEKEAAEKKAAQEAAKKSGKALPAQAKNIRKLKPGKGTDKLIEEMMEIWLQSNVAEQSFIPKKYWSKNYKEVLRVMSIATVYIYEEDGVIMGFAGSMEEQMVAITVVDTQRGRGIGSLLLDKLKDEMGILEASVYTKNKGAMSFFQKNEFQAKDIQLEESTGEEIVLLNW